MKDVIFFFFFFSSRRRHTRFDCDWSSDVCSSDLNYLYPYFPVTRRAGLCPDTVQECPDGRVEMLLSPPFDGQRLSSVPHLPCAAPPSRCCDKHRTLSSCPSNQTVWRRSSRRPV